jgi:hypothetical protein
MHRTSHKNTSKPNPNARFHPAPPLLLSAAPPRARGERATRQHGRQQRWLRRSGSGRQHHGSGRQRRGSRGERATWQHGRQQRWLRRSWSGHRRRGSGRQRRGSGRRWCGHVRGRPEDGAMIWAWPGLNRGLAWPQPGGTCPSCAPGHRCQARGQAPPIPSPGPCVVRAVLAGREGSRAALSTPREDQGQNPVLRSVR